MLEKREKNERRDKPLIYTFGRRERRGKVKVKKKSWFLKARQEEMRLHNSLEERKGNRMI